MKRNCAFAVLFAVAMLAISSAAFAVGPEPFDFAADCDGWSLNGYMHFGGSTQVDWTFWVKLVQNGDTLYSYANSGILYSPGNFSFGAGWGDEFCGDLKAIVWFMWVGEYGPGIKKVEIPFTCECEENGACHYTPGYWKNHASMWPVMELTMGCVTYNQAQLLTILNTPVGGDATIILAYHLIAAKLNVANGADDSINGMIAEGDRLLCLYPLYSNPRGTVRTRMLAVKDALCAFNEYEVPGCGDENPPIDEMSGDIRLSPAAPAEDASWGAIKSIYR
jgi:hypothetical protein